MTNYTTITTMMNNNNNNNNHNNNTLITDGDNDHSDVVSTSSITTQDLQQPILVGYAFGPKKMSTMATVMAEASRARVVGVVMEEEGEDNEDETVTATVTVTNNTVTNNSSNNSNTAVLTTSKVGLPSHQHTSTNNKKHALTTAALSRHHEQHEKEQHNRSSTAVGAAGAGGGGSLNNIVRYFRSSCSSIGSDDGDDTSCFSTSNNTSTTGTTALTRHSYHHHPVRVSFVPVNLNEPLEEQHGGRFDILLHKMTEDILCLSTAEEQQQKDGVVDNHTNDNDDTNSSSLQHGARIRIHRLQEYQRLHPHCCLADDPDNIKVVMSRSAISSKLQQALVGVTSGDRGWPVATPTFCNYYGSSNTDDDEKKQKQQLTLRYPLIAKPLPAAGTKKSHCMGIVLTPQGLARVNTPCLLQEYANHDGTLYKVYVLGDDTFVFCRPSLPNLPVYHDDDDDDDQLEQEPYSYVEFDSQRPYPKLAEFGLEDNSTTTPPNCDTSSSQPSTMMTVTEVTPIVQALKRAFGLELFGFDILVSSATTTTATDDEEEQQRKLLVVDVNYFPSFKEVSNFPSLLAKFLVQRAVQTRKLTTTRTTSTTTATTPTPRTVSL
mmetsp:Transcript_2030/g.3197  ORF Transcript_2030/g.3197 Transcript_2030/m.3197 type:complete len:604 (-) Transcript_2030:126-1937(-)